MHYDNEIIKSECVTIYEEEADHLLQISLNAKETKNIFKHMIDDSQSLQLETPIQLVPLELNQPLTDEELNAIQSVPDINSTDNQTVPSAHEPEDTDLKITAKPSIPEEALNVTQAVESDITPAKISEQDKSVMGLVRKCVNFLDQNVTQGASNSIDIDRVKAGVRQILSHSNLPSNFVETITTPNSIVVKLQGDIQLSANKINNMRDHFLSVVGLSLRQVYPEPGVMVLVFDRDQRETVHYLELIKRTLSQREATLNQGFNNRILIGQLEFSDGSCFYRLDGPSPHALIGGQTKSGKSILMNNMITDLIMTNTPDNLKLRLFDPKQVEFVSYSQSAHLAHPVVLDKDEAVIRLTELENLMNQRYVRLKDLGLKNIESFNQKYPAEPMSREVVFFDELADWILDSEFKKSANNIISRLSSKGRAAGIHLVLATQRPSNDVVSTILRANLDTKIALKVDRDLNSEIILGESGAENLLGYGHGIVKTEGDTMSVQVGFTDQEVFDQLVEIIIQYWNA